MTLVARNDTELTGSYEIPASSFCTRAFGEIEAVVNSPTIYLELGDRASLTGDYGPRSINASGTISGLTPPDVSLYASR